MKINVIFYDFQHGMLRIQGLSVAFLAKDFYHNDKNKDKRDDEFIY